MKNLRFGGRQRDRKDFSGRRHGDDNSRRFSMHDAVCDECGENCQVPFKPSSGKPVYCSDCFEKKGGRERNSSNRRDSRNRNFGNSDQGRTMKGIISDSSIMMLSEKIGTLNSRLEDIVNLLSPKDKQKPVELEAKAENSQKTKIKKGDIGPEIEPKTVKKPKAKSKSKVTKKPQK